MARNVEIKARVDSLAAIEPIAAALSGQPPQAVARTTLSSPAPKAG